MNAANGSGTLDSSPFILSKPVKIAVVSNVGNLNLGDEAILRSTLHALRNRLPNASIRVYTISPAEAAGRHGVDTAPLRSRVTERPAAQSRGSAHPLRTLARGIPVVAPILGTAARLLRAAAAAAREPAFIVRSWRGLRGTDLLLVAGSNQLEDWFGGPSGYPYTILLWTILARIVGAPVAFVSVGAGPLDSRLSRWMCVRAVRLATYASFRDAESLGLMRRLGYHRGGIVVPDLAFGLALEDPRARPSGASPRIGVNVFPYRDPRYDPHVRDGGAAFAAYLDGIAGVVAGAVQRGMQPVLFGMQQADELVLDLVQERLRSCAPELGDVERRMPPTLADVIALVDGCDVVVATRYHGILLGVLRGRPTVGICYQSKSRQLLEMAGLPDYAVEADDVDQSAILDRLTPTPGAGSSELIRARAMELRAQCDSGLDEALERCLRPRMPGRMAT